MEQEKVYTLQLIITENCNLRCSYCFEINKVSLQMPISLAKEILERELSGPTDFDKYEIDLAGGEPFLYFNYLKEIVDYCIENNNRWGKNIHFFIGSNLTLLTPEIKKWLEEKKDFIFIGTSLDGTKEAHDRCRSNSYDSVISNISFYKKTYPYQRVKMTISADTVGCIYEGIKNIENMGLKFSANVVFEPIWGDKYSKQKYLIKFAEQLDLLVNHYIENPNIEIPIFLSLPIKLILNKNNSEHKWCGSGVSMCCYDPDGRRLPCHRFSRFSTNKIYEGEKSIGQSIYTKCDNCIFIDACPTCAGYNWQINGHPESRTSYHCEFIKLQFLATAKLKYLMNDSLVNKLVENKLEEKNKISLKYYDTLLDLQASYYVLENLDQHSIIASVEDKQ